MTTKASEIGILLIATNAVSLAIDAWDAIRFALGERRP